MKKIVLGIRRIEKMTSKYSKTLSKNELSNKRIIRRHPFSTRDLKKGTILDLGNIKFLRPTKSQNPIDLNFFYKKKIKKKISKNVLIKKSDVIQ